MSEERLEEIQDSVDFQREVLLANNLGTLSVDEEQELIDEIERLNNDIKELLKENSNKEKVIRKYEETIDKAIEYINKTPLKKGTEAYRIELLNILQGSDKE